MKCICYSWHIQKLIADIDLAAIPVQEKKECMDSSYFAFWSETRTSNTTTNFALKKVRLSEGCIKDWRLNKTSCLPKWQI